MDEFGVLTERFGLKPQGKSVPMAKLKPTTSPSITKSENFGVNTKSSSFSDSVYGSFHSNTKTESYGLDEFADLFGSSNKFTSNSDSTSSIFPGFDDGDIFDGMPGIKSSVPTKTEDLFGSLSSNLRQSAQVDDLLGDFVRNDAKLMTQKRNGLRQEAKSNAQFDELIPGFGGSSFTSNGANTNGDRPKRSTAHTTGLAFTSVEDPFVVLESTTTRAYTSSETFTDPFEQISKLNNSGDTKPGASNVSSSVTSFPIPKPVSKAHKVKSSSSSPIDDLEEFAMGRVRNNADEGNAKASTKKAGRYSEAADAAEKCQQKNVDDLESFFGMASRSRSVPKFRATTPDPLFDVHIYKRKPEVPLKTSVASVGIKKSSSETNLEDDLSSIFGAAAMFGEFQEIEGESEERRKARMGRQRRTDDRVAKALADMNQRNLQTQQEQEERRRVSESLDGEIMRWAAGKEGNVRALLSSLHYVLWPGCGWQPVSLTDIITSSQVKKVYKKATLYVHPDKVQQKGASLEQKYTAEKVFDILKEAWNKFNKVELS